MNGGNSEFGGGNVIIVDPALPTDRPFEPNCRWQGGMACPSEAGLCVPGNRICDGIFDCPGKLVPKYRCRSDRLSILKSFPCVHC